MAMRFTYIDDPYAKGGKLAGRRQVNPDLTVKDAVDVGLFRRQIGEALGALPKRDGGFSVVVADTYSGIHFKAYAAQSGPAYGGPIDYFEEFESGLRLRPDVEDVLRRFEQVITGKVPNE
ncbi:hypothetical protein NKH48_33685 [Mesorhizobium sp. M1233]|uniref:hypothetical protein n=1 Tax=unclassified Mesorhizobium TaxID=325217 RepID=UPI003338832D